MNKIYEDPSFLESLEPTKRDFILELMKDSEKITSKAMILPFFKVVNKKAIENNITFTPAEMQFLISILKENANPKELDAINRIIPKTE